MAELSHQELHNCAVNSTSDSVCVHNNIMLKNYHALDFCYIYVCYQWMKLCHTVPYLPHEQSNVLKYS